MSINILPKTLQSEVEGGFTIFLNPLWGVGKHIEDDASYWFRI